MCLKPPISVKRALSKEPYKVKRDLYQSKQTNARHQSERPMCFCVCVCDTERERERELTCTTPTSRCLSCSAASFSPCSLLACAAQVCVGCHKVCVCRVSQSLLHSTAWYRTCTLILNTHHYSHTQHTSLLSYPTHITTLIPNTHHYSHTQHTSVRQRWHILERLKWYVYSHTTHTTHTPYVSHTLCTSTLVYSGP